MFYGKERGYMLSFIVIAGALFAFYKGDFIFAGLNLLLALIIILALGKD